MTTIQIPPEITAMAAMLAAEVNDVNDKKEEKKENRKEKAKKERKEKKAKKEKKEKKEKKTKKDKKPLSAYMLFNQEVSKKIKAECPEKEFKDIGKEVGARWTTMDAAARAPYETKAKEQKEEWLKTHPKETKTSKRKRANNDNNNNKNDNEEEDNNNKEPKKKKQKTRKDEKEKTQKKQKRVEEEEDDVDDVESKPAYVRYAETVRPNIQKNNPTMSPRSVSNEVASGWRRLTSDEKTQYSKGDG